MPYILWFLTRNSIKYGCILSVTTPVFACTSYSIHLAGGGCDVSDDKIGKMPSREPRATRLLREGAQRATRAGPPANRIFVARAAGARNARVARIHSGNLRSPLARCSQIHSFSRPPRKSGSFFSTRRCTCLEEYRVLKCPAMTTSFLNLPAR